MKPIQKISFLICGIIMISSCFPVRKLDNQQVSVSSLSEANSVKEGSVVYGLPRSVFTVIVEMDRTIEIPGPYAKFAGDLLGLDKVITKENESWAVSGITVKTNEELDPSELYVIESNSLLHTNALKLKNEGLILDLNSVGFSSGFEPGLDKNGTDQFISFDLGSDEYYLMQRDTAYKRVSIDSTFIRIPYIVEKKKKLTTEQLAEKAAKRLMEMRDGKHLILTGEANVFPQNDASINEMNRIEKEYTELFAGKTIIEKRTFTSQVIPSKDMIGKQVILFQLSEITGPLAENSKGGKPVVIEFVPEKKSKEITFITKPEPESDSEGTVYDKLFYRVPDVANIKISIGTEVLYNSRKLIYQFGNIVQLPANYIIGK
ncbi:MAG: DUF4831 family protein [Bacteroidales bacterium]|nr:DUF4831 family protein [Bacteroidales bacterium]